MFIQPSHEHVFLSVCLISERAAQARDPGKASWRTCMKTSPLLNVPLLRLVRVPVTPVRHYRSITYAPNLFVLCINIEADELVSAFLLPSWVTGTFLPLSFGTGKSMNAGISGWLMREKEANPFVGCQRVFFWVTFWGWIIKRQHQIKPVASWVSQTEEEEKNKTEKMWDIFLTLWSKRVLIV